MSQQHLDVAVFSVDPPAADMFHGGDPESGVLVGAFADPLIFADENGALCPALAVRTELTIVQEGIPSAIPVEACYLGWQESLTLLVDPEIKE